MKKEWRRPELVILVRNKPEEAVLDLCKIGGRTGPDGTACLDITGQAPCNPFTPS